MVLRASRALVHLAHRYGCGARHGRAEVSVKRRHSLTADEEEDLLRLLQLRKLLNAKTLMVRFNISRSVIDRIQRERKMLAVPHETKRKAQHVSVAELDDLTRELQGT
jgi:hypothetical protein